LVGELNTIERDDFHMLQKAILSTIVFFLLIVNIFIAVFFYEEYKKLREGQQSQNLVITNTNMENIPIETVPEPIAEPSKEESADSLTENNGDAKQPNNNSSETEIANSSEVENDLPLVNGLDANYFYFLKDDAEIENAIQWGIRNSGNFESINELPKYKLNETRDLSKSALIITPFIMIADKAAVQYSKYGHILSVEEARGVYTNKELGFLLYFGGVRTDTAWDYGVDLIQDGKILQPYSEDNDKLFIRLTYDVDDINFYKPAFLRVYYKKLKGIDEEYLIKFEDYR